MVPGKADAKAQEEFLKEYEKLNKNKGKGDVVMLMDAVHPQHNPVMACGWIKQGKDFQVCSNTGRKRLNINGPVSVDTLNMVMRFDDTINANSSIELFKAIEKAYPDAGKITIICDNARYSPLHTSQLRVRMASMASI